MVKIEIKKQQVNYVYIKLNRLIYGPEFDDLMR